MGWPRSERRDSRILLLPFLLAQRCTATKDPEILTPSPEPTREGLEKMRQAGRPAFNTEPKILRDGKTSGPASAFMGAVAQGDTDRHHHGYRWAAP